MENFPKPSEWVDRYGEALYAFALHKTKSTEAVEDAVQETFLRGIRKLPSFEGNSSLKTWLTGILKNVVREADRKQHLAIEDSFGPQRVELSLAELRALPPDQAVQRSEFWETVEHCLERLPMKTAEIFRAKEIEGLSSREVAEKLGVTSSNIWVTVHRARKFMRNCMAHVIETIKGRRD